jgi:hypothetical protein
MVNAQCVDYHLANGESWDRIGIEVASLPEGVKEEQYDATCDATIALMRYGGGLPWHRQAGLQSMGGAPLGEATMWERCEATADAAMGIFLSLMAIDGSGLARGDFFLERKTERLIFNEINTLPGFTSISMYPKPWEASGVGYSESLNRLIEFAFQWRREKSRDLTSYE